MQVQRRRLYDDEEHLGDTGEPAISSLPRTSHLYTPYSVPRARAPARIHYAPPVTVLHGTNLYLDVG